MSQGVQVTALAVQAIAPLFMVLVARCVKGRRATHLLKMRLHVRAYLLHTLSPSPAKLGGWLGGAHAALPPAIASHHVTPCDATKRGALLLPQCPEPGVPFHCRLPDEGAIAVHWLCRPFKVLHTGCAMGHGMKLRIALVPA